MEVVKRGYGLFSIAMSQSEIDDFETACREENRLSENVLQEFFDKFIRAAKTKGIGDTINGT